MVKEFEDKNTKLVSNKLKLNTKSKIINIHHKDLDGVGSSIVIKNCFRNPVYISVKYQTIGEILLKINYDEYDAVIITDVSPDDQTVEKLGNIWKDKILLLDHHDTAVRLHDPENMKFVHPGECGMTITKKFFEKYYNFKFDYLDGLDRIINDYDMWIKEDPKSEDMNLLYLKYWDERFRERFYKGLSDFTFEEKKYLEEKHKEFKKIYKDLDVWELMSIHGCLYIADNWANELADKILNEKTCRVTISRNPKTNGCSIRSRISNIHIGDMLSGLGFGGGHKEAGGFWEPDTLKFREKVDLIEKYIYDNCVEMRKDV
jgi:oligoribonuclease NrnB/cAMP/cGMP phosphodiesterase (DHH superfamily)